mgnify:CR=1 FL=1
MIYKLKYIFSALYGKINKPLFSLVFLMSLGMAFEFIGLGVIFPLILSLIQPNELLEYGMIMTIYDSFNFNSESQLTYLFLFLILIVYLVKTIFMAYFAFKQNIIIGTLISKMSYELYEIYLNQPFSFHTKNNSSTLIKNIQVEINYLSSFIMSVVNIIIDVALILSIVVTLILVEPIGALSVAIYFIFTGLVYYQIFKPFIRRWGEKRGVIEKSMIDTLIEGLQSIRELILFSGINVYSKKFKELNNHYALITAKNNTSQQIPRFYFELSAIIGIILFVFVLITKENVNVNVLTIVGVFTAATFRIIPSLNRTVYSLQNIKFYTPSIDIIYNELKGVNLNLRSNNYQNDISFNRQLKLSKVYFKYESCSNWILENINLTINRGDFIGLTGESGAGKSTLVDLLAGIYKPNKGQILVDNTDINSDYLTTQNWINKIGYVSQDIQLIDDNIKNNILLGIDQDKIDLDKVKHVIEKAGLKKFIESLKEGLNTQVGERGVKLSGGQRQRIGIARALYKNPSVLFFDEGTSALDNKIEKDVLKTITNLMGDKTIIMISHKLSTLKFCNKVYDINQKKLIEVC